jgi:hypothetical protein
MADGTNKVLVDRFTLVHFAAGAGITALGVPWQGVAVGSVAFEAAEQKAKDAHPDMFPNPSQDSFGNSICDIAAATLGAYLVERYGKKKRKTRKKRR